MFVFFAWFLIIAFLTQTCSTIQICRFFRLTKNSLTYYTKVQACSWGFVPLDERGCIPINLITRMDVDPVNAKGVSPGPTHFNIWVTNAENNR